MIICGKVTIGDVVRRRKPDYTYSQGAGEHYLRGVNKGYGMENVTLAQNNCWGGLSKDGGSVCSYEIIGYHTGSIDFLCGVVDSGCLVAAYYNGEWRSVVKG